MKYLSIHRCVALVACVLLMVGCAEIPRVAVDANNKVTHGIEALEENGIALINAWEETAYKLLDENFDDVYARAEEELREKRDIPSDSSLTKEQIKAVAGLTIHIRDEMRAEINAQADEMRAIIKENAQHSIKTNERISDLMVSANSLTKERISLVEDFGDLVPIPDSLDDL